MKLHKVTGKSRNGDSHKVFTGSQADAASARKMLNTQRDVPREALVTEEIEVEANKAGILAALNEHC